MGTPDNNKEFLKLWSEQLNKISADILGSTPDKLILNTLIEIGLNPEGEVIITKVEVLNRWDSDAHKEAAEAFKKTMTSLKVEVVVEKEELYGR
jgi:hypothetical protein